MVLRKVLGAVVMSLVFFMPVYLPQHAFAACCVCNNGVVVPNSPRNCSNCGCGGALGEIQCIEKIDDNLGEVTFKDKRTGKLTTMDFTVKARNMMKEGQCGNVTAEKMETMECTGFAAQSSGSSGK